MRFWPWLGLLLMPAAAAVNPPPAAQPGPTALQERLQLPLDLRLQPADLDTLPAAEPQGALRLSLEEAVLFALRYNRSLTVEQLNPLVAGTFEAIERAAFDPALFAELRFDRGRRPRSSVMESSRGSTAEIGVGKRLPTGTDIELSINHSREDSSGTSRQQQHGAAVDLSVTQALLRGASRRANLVDLQQAELDTLASHYELRGFAESLVADVEQAYWDYALAADRLAIFENSLQLAERQLDETEQRIRAGALPEAERTAARAEVARRRQELIDARADHSRLRLSLLRLLSPPSAAGWQRPVEPVSRPLPPAEPLDPVAGHIALALRLRPELNEARLRLRQGRLEAIQTRQGLLPRLDLFMTLGRTGYAASFGEAFRDIGGDGYDLAAGIRFEYPLGNRAAEARHGSAQLRQTQARASLDNLAQLVALEVQQAYLEAQRAAAQIDASRATRELQAAVLETEQARLRAGRSTGLLVAQAQRDLLAAQTEEAGALVAYRQALTELYRLDGSLLVRRAVAAPGEQPVAVAAPRTSPGFATEAQGTSSRMLD
jgi:outer membrane protein